MKRIFTLLLFLPCFALQLLAQPGALDPSFNPGTGTNGFVYRFGLQSDGKVLIGGIFNSYNGTARNHIARVNADGTLDTGFDPGAGANNFVWSLALQSDGKVLIGGDFTSYNGTARNRIARLNADGTLDTGFDPGTGMNNQVVALAVQSNGKVLIGGSFTSYNGTARNRIARLNADGTLDTGFDPGTGVNGQVLAIAVQSDGKVLIVGDFTGYNGTARNRIARLNADGTLDTGFDPGTSVNGQVLALAVQSDGKVLIVGDFTDYNGTARNRIARLNADGTLDTGFDPGTGANDLVHSLAVQSDGKVLIGGGFANYNGTGRSGIARLNADGTLDTSFNPGTGANGNVYSIAVQSDGRMLIGGNFTVYNGTGRNTIARILGPAAPAITTFSPTSGPIGTTVIITGQNFNTTPSNNMIMFGATRAAVTAASVTSLTVTVPAGATYEPPTATDLATGLSGWARTSFSVTSAPARNSAFLDLDAPFVYDQGFIPYRVIVCDIDGDGKADLVGDYHDQGTVTGGLMVTRNVSATGSINASSMHPPLNLAMGTAGLREYAIGDLDGDGKPDLIVVSLMGNKVTAFRNTSSPGAISFAAPVDIISGAYGPAIIRDVDNDGKADIVLIIRSSGFDVFRNVGSPGSITSASFSSPVSYETSVKFYSIAAGDIDGDGRPEIAASEDSANKMYVFGNTSIPGGLNAGSFAAPVTFSSGAGLGFDVGLADLNGDGKPELMYRKNYPGMVVVFRNVSTPGAITTGSLEAGVEYPFENGLSSYTAGDLNGDGHTDIVVSLGSGSIAVLENKALSGAFTAGSFTKTTITSGSSPGGITLADIDGDGKADLTGGIYFGPGNSGIAIMHNRPLRPRVQATNVLVSNITATSASISWTNGDGAKRAVFRALATTGQALPLNNTAYNGLPGGGTQIGSTGWFCVYNGTGTSVNINVGPGNNYRIMVLEYGENNWESSQTFLTATATGNPVNFSTPLTLNSVSRASAEKSNAASVNYTATFNGPPTGLTTSNFSLTTTGITGASITGISGSGTIRTVTVNTGTGSGTLTLNLSNSTGLSSALTNTLPFAGQTYTIDKTAPQLSSVAISTNNVHPGRARLGDDVILAFTADKTLNTPAVTIAGHAVTASNSSGHNWSASWTMTAGDTEGIVPFSIVFTDVLGNTGATVAATTNSSSMIYDKTRPTLSPVSIASNGPVSSKAKTGDVITLTFTASEPVAINSVMIGGNTVTATNAGGNTWSAAYTVTAADNEGPVLFSISFYDQAGNPGTAVKSTTDNSTVTINRANPDLAALTMSVGSISPAFDAGVTVYTASVPAGTASITVTPTASAPGSVISVKGTIVADGIASQPIPLSAGDNAINIIVTSLDGSLTKTYTLVVSRPKSNQAITFNAIPAKAYGDAGFTLSASGGASGNPVTFSSSNTLVATVSGSTVTITGTGVTTITASQPGNANYNAADDVQQTLLINKAGQAIVFNALAAKTYGDAAFNLTAAGGASGSAVTYASSNTTVATVSGNTVTIVGAGTTNITASQAGNTNYNAAADVQQTLTINKAALVIAAENKTKEQGAVNPPLTVGYSGFIPGESSSVLTAQPAVSTTATIASAPGSYPITASGATAANYTISYTAGSLTVTAPANHAPTGIILSRSDIDENNTAGAAIGTFSTIDPDAGDTFSYSLVSGTGSADNASFTISGSELRAAVSFDFESKTGYSIRIRSTDNGGLSFEKVFTIAINDVNEAPPANEPPTLNVIANQTICYTGAQQSIALGGISAGPEAGQTTAISVSSTNSSLFSSLTVTAGSSGTATLSYTPGNTTGGTALITVTVKDNGGTDNGGNDTFTRTFTITINPAATATISSDKGAQISKGDIAVLTASGGISYIWSSATGIISGQNTASISVRPAQTTTYTVSVTNANGCSTSQTFTIRVMEDYQAISGTNILSPNGDGKNDRLIIRNLDMYPNNELKMFDRAGRMIYSKKGYNNEWDGTFNGLPLAEGTYYYIISFGSAVKKGYVSVVRE